VDPVAALTRLGGVATTADLLRLTTRARLRAAERDGLVRRAARGRYALPTARPALALAADVGGYASHLCAAAEHGWEIARQPVLPQVVVPRHRGLPHDVAGDVRRCALSTADVVGSVTSPVLTVLHCARDLPFDEALAVADSALRHRDIEGDQLVAAAVPWPARVRRVASYADGRAANPFESVLRALAIRADAQVIPQYEVRARGLVTHPDLVDPLRGLVVEADSWGFHSSRSDHERDCVRYNALTSTGWQVLRFTYEHAMVSQPYVVATIAATIEVSA
jgi:hypothetical protein